MWEKPDGPPPAPLVPKAGRPPSENLKRLLVDEAGGRCAICGYDRCVNMVFHHVDPKRKAFQLSMNTTKAVAACREEMCKCVLLCANCHGEVEAGLVTGPPAGARYGETT